MKHLKKQILKLKRQEIKYLRRNFDNDLLKAAAFSVGGEYRSVEVDVRQAGQLPVFVEIQQRFLSEALELEGFEPVRSVRTLLKAGLTGGIIVATDREFLGGDPGWINLIKHNCELPVLQKDFFIDPVQLYQGKAIGADAFLLNGGLANEKQLLALLDAVAEMGLEAYLELDELKLPETLRRDGLTGIIVNIDFQQDPTPEAVSEFRKELDPQLVVLLRCFPADEAAVRRVVRASIDGLVLNGNFWQTPAIGDDFLTLMSRIADVGTTDKGNTRET